VGGQPRYGSGGGLLETGGQPRYGGGGLLESSQPHHQSDLMPKFDFSHCVMPKFEPKFEVSVCVETTANRNMAYFLAER
jgi:hypothetical protein